MEESLTKNTQSNKKRKANVLSSTNHVSKSVSSHKQLDIACANKIRKKKIRSTLDFNQFSHNSISRDSVSEVKIKKKSTRKNKVLYDLPKINNLSEDPFRCIENISPAKSRKNSQISICKWSISDTSDSIIEPGQEKTEPKQKKVNKNRNAKNYKKKCKKLRKGQSTSSNTSDTDPDIEFKNKSRKIIKISNKSNRRDSEIGKADDDFLNIPTGSLHNLSTEDETRNVYKPYMITRSVAKKKLNRNYGRETKSQSDQKETRHLDTMCKAIIKNKSTCASEKVKSLSNFCNIGEDHEVAKRAFISNESCSTENSFAKSDGKSTDKTNFAMAVDHNSFGLDDVFYSPYLSEEDENRKGSYVLKESSNSSLILKSKPEGHDRNSVRFSSTGEKIINRRTINYKDSTDNLLQGLSPLHQENACSLTPDKRGNTSGTFERSSPEELSHSLKNNSTFDKISEVVVPQNNILFRNSFNESNKENIETNKITVFEAQSPTKSFYSPKCDKTSTNYTFQSSIVESSPTLFDQEAVNLTSNNSNRKNQNSSKISIKDSRNIDFSQISHESSHSIIDLTTPLPNRKCIDSDPASSEKSSNKKSTQNYFWNKDNREATFIRENGLDENKSDISTVKQDKNKSTNINITEDFITEQQSILGNLNRTVSPSKTPLLLEKRRTFTKEEINTPYVDMNSDSLMLNSIDTKHADTSKVSKRKRWDKSHLGVDYLDSSLDIENISAPWQNEFYNSFSRSVGKSSNLCITEGTPRRNKSLSKYKTVTVSPVIKKDELSGAHLDTSTPLPNRKTNLFRQALLNDKKNLTINGSKNLSMEVVRPEKRVRTKIPNFALIHQKAYDKLESLKEMSERKAVRAKLLLSSHKPIVENVSKLKPISNRQQLRYSPLKMTPKLKINDDGNNSNKISGTKIKNLAPSTSNIKVSNKKNKITPIEKKAQLLVKSRIPKANRLVPEKKGLTRFGFKEVPEGITSTTKEEQIKAIASKTKIVKNTLDERRNAIQGVRSNRRFELLMKMRNK